MEALKELLPLLISLSLALLVFVVGMDAGPRDLTYVLRSPKRLGAALLSVNVITPIVAILMIQLIDISFAAKAGILLMAISPAPPLVPGKVLKLSGGHKDYAYGLYVALILLAVVIVPLSVWVLGRVFRVEVAIPPLAVARSVAIQVLVPLVLGVVVRRIAPGFATHAAPMLYKVAMVMVLVAVIPLVIKIWPAMMSLAGDGSYTVMALIVVVAMAAGAFLGGRDPDQRAALAAATATRHPGIALMIAKGNYTDPHIVAAVLGFLLISLLVAIPCQAMFRRMAAAPLAQT